MKKASIITIICGGALMLISKIILPLIITILLPKPTPSVGIIGGADGPAAMFVTSTLWLNSVHGILFILGLIALIVGITFLIISIFKKKD